MEPWINQMVNSTNLKTELSWKVFLHKGHSQKPSSVLIGSMEPPSGPTIEISFLFKVSILAVRLALDSSVKWHFKCIRMDLLDSLLKLQSATEQRYDPSDIAGVTTHICSFSVADISVKLSYSEEAIGSVLCEIDVWFFEFASRIRRRSQAAFPLMNTSYFKSKFDCQIFK